MAAELKTDNTQICAQNGFGNIRIRSQQIACMYGCFEQLVYAGAVTAAVSTTQVVKQ
jgi:hypothetical protein